MTAFSVSDTAFEGFRITRENPLAVALWAVLFFIGVLATTGLMESGSWAPLMAMIASGHPDPNAFTQAVVANSAGLARDGLALMGTQLVFQAVIQTAVNRAVLNPADRAFGYLRLGLAELRTLAVLLMVDIILAGTYMAFVVLLALSSVLGAVGGLLAVLIFLGMIAALVVANVRLSLAVSASFDRRKITLGRSIALTRGGFWRLVGAYLIAGILAVLVFVLGIAVTSGVQALVGHGAAPAANLTQTFTPEGIAVLALSSAVQTLAVVILFSVSAGLYKILNASTPEQAF